MNEIGLETMKFDGSWKFSAAGGELFGTVVFRRIERSIIHMAEHWDQALAIATLAAPAILCPPRAIAQFNGLNYKSLMDYSILNKATTPSAPERPYN